MHMRLSRWSLRRDETVDCSVVALLGTVETIESGYRPRTVRIGQSRTPGGAPIAAVLILKQ